VKTDIHPKYFKAKVHCGSCGTEFEVGSTRPELRVDVCSACHPFFTGRQTIIDIAGHEGYLTVGLFENGQPGELFITMAKEGSTIGGLMVAVGTLSSMAMQYGVPLEALVKKFAHQRFEPSGFTKNPDIRNASSIIDYVFRWMALQFIPGYRENTRPALAQTELAIPGLSDAEKKTVNRPVPDLALAEDTELVYRSEAAEPVKAAKLEPQHGSATTVNIFVNQADAPSCPNCGHIAVRNGACYKCLNCGESLGCS
jgi:ribonucleoside-diphosphate reductase alpha chain